MAEKAGVTKKILYYHFQTKDELIAAYLASRDQPTLAYFADRDPARWRGHGDADPSRRRYVETAGDVAADLVEQSRAAKKPKLTVSR